MVKKYQLDKESIGLWKDTFYEKKEVAVPKSPGWTVYLQSSLFVNNEVGILFDSDTSRWLVRATIGVGQQIVQNLATQSVEDILKNID